MFIRTRDVLFILLELVNTVYFNFCHFLLKLKFNLKLVLTQEIKYLKN